jgi:hypothetical protein
VPKPTGPSSEDNGADYEVCKGSNEFSMFPPVKLFACDMQSVVFLPVYLML